MKDKKSKKTNHQKHEIPLNSDVEKYVETYEYSFKAAICRYELTFELYPAEKLVKIISVIREGDKMPIGRFMTLFSVPRVEGRLREYLALKGHLNAKLINLVL